MQNLTSIIADEIRCCGPLPFSRFMELALYHPRLGYYRRPRDPFGKSGDFQTAEQVQPVFGRLMAAYLKTMARGLGAELPAVVEMGAGRREMAEAFADFAAYVPVDVDAGEMPEGFEGIVFSNEFFDAIPVDLAVCREGEWFYRRVGSAGEGFRWDDALPYEGTIDAESGIEVMELQHHRVAALRNIAQRLKRGLVVTIDYGYTRRELQRFPQGTLMSYRRHHAIDDVLTAPGDQDITAHVDFSCLQDEGSRTGLKTETFVTLGGALLRAGEADAFASALAGEEEADVSRHRLQLKSLLFGMGETFRVLVQSKGVEGK